METTCPVAPQKMSSEIPEIKNSWLKEKPRLPLKEKPIHRCCQWTSCCDRSNMNMQTSGIHTLTGHFKWCHSMFRGSQFWTNCLPNVYEIILNHVKLLNHVKPVFNQIRFCEELWFPTMLSLKLSIKSLSLVYQSQSLRSSILLFIAVGVLPPLEPADRSSYSLLAPASQESRLVGRHGLDMYWYVLICLQVAQFGKCNKIITNSSTNHDKSLWIYVYTYIYIYTYINHI